MRAATFALPSLQSLTRDKKMYPATLTFKPSSGQFVACMFTLSNRNLPTCLVHFFHAKKGRKFTMHARKKGGGKCDYIHRKSSVFAHSTEVVW